MIVPTERMRRPALTIPQHLESSPVHDLPTIEYPSSLLELLHAVRAAGGRGYLVGGWVRDVLLGRSRGDIDVEIYGLPPDLLRRTLEPLGRTVLVGRSFGVFKVTIEGATYDVAMPRIDRKTGPGHRGFEVSVDPDLDPALAARRRDLTVNALLLDPLSGELIDHVGGLDDLEAGILRHTSDTFSEDPLRVLRVAQLAARLRFAVAPETLSLCREVDLSELPPERIEGELRKLLLDSLIPSWGLDVLRAAGGLTLFPELEALVDCPQNPRFHPEGDVWIHTGLALDQAATLRAESPRPYELMLAVLCHDLGKPACTRRIDERITSHRHETTGEEPTRAFLARITRETDLVEGVVRLVRHHLAPTQLYTRRDEIHDGAIRRLATRVDVGQLVLVARADHLGRLKSDDGFPAGRWLLDRCVELEVRDGAPPPLIRGRDLLALGIEPGPRMGRILRTIYERQLDGDLTTRDEALNRVLSDLAREDRGTDPGGAGPRRAN